MQADELRAKAAALRRATFEMVMRAGKGHLGGSFSCTEILVALYYGGILRYRAGDPHWAGRDRFILSKAHGSNTLHYLLADLGFYPMRHVEEFLANGSLLSGHTDHRTPGIEIAGGSLGHGLGVAAGMALGLKLDGGAQRVFCIIGDGESQEGSIWEAGLFARQHALDNLVAFTDYNGLGSENRIDETAGLDPLEDKWRAFGWDTVSVDGHDLAALLALKGSFERRGAGRPLMVVARTVKGKGLPPLENTPAAHHTLPKGEDVALIRSHLA